MYIDFKIDAYKIPVDNNSELQTNSYVYVLISSLKLNIFFRDKKELEKLNYQSSVGKKTWINR